MRKLLFSAIMFTTAITVHPARAAYLFNSVGDTTGVLPFNGLIDETPQPGLLANLVLTLNSLVNGVFTFGYTLTNTSTVPVAASRVSVFGFNTAPDPLATGNSATGAFNKVTLDGNAPGGLGTRDVCVSTGDCAGGLSGAPVIGLTATGTLTLNFGAGKTAVSLDDFFVRYQSIVVPPGLIDVSGVGTVIPEPGAWMTMLAGFGALGCAMRRRCNVPANFT